MSLIHEALKKAEAQRRLGELPTLGTPVAGRRKPRPLLPVLAALIAVALGAGWWLSTREGAGDAPATVAAGDAPAASPRAKPDAAPATGRNAPTVPATSSAAERRPAVDPNAPVKMAGANGPVNQAPSQAPPPTVRETAERESEPHPAGTNPLAPGEAAPLALGAPPPPTATNDPAGVAAKSAIKQKQGAAAPPPVASATKAGAPPAANAGTSTAPAANVARPAAPPPAVAVPPPAAAPVATAPAPAPSLENLPLYWQLPLNVRKDLPALKLSMHVYSPTPDQRFVILNGNRQKEGDDLGADVRLTEIRVDGAVLEYHGQRFLVPRGGS